MPIDPWLPENYSNNIPAIPIRVYRYDAEQSGAEAFQWLPSLQCVSIERYIGVKPAVARFAYTFDQSNPYAPQSIEEALSTEISLPQTVGPGDRLVVTAVRPDGQEVFLFDGEPYGFEGHLDEEEEGVDLICASVTRRLGDTPVPGAIMRQGDKTDVPTEAGDENPTDIETDIPGVFNPKGVGNATSPESVDSSRSDPLGQHFPVFVDHRLPTTFVNRALWTAPMAVGYLLYTTNDAQEYVINPARAVLDSTLVAKEPIDGVTFDPSDSSTYTQADIVVPNTPIKGRAPDQLVEQLINDKGFAVIYTLSGESAPRNELTIVQLQLGPIKDVYLQARGAYLDLDRSNTAQASFTRDVAEAVNQWSVDGALVRYEAAFILACAYPMTPGDAANESTIRQYDWSGSGKTSPDYRDHIFDECGEAHYVPGSDTISQTVPSLDDIFGKPNTVGDQTVPRYTHRRRPAIGELCSLDDQGKPKKYELAYSTDYAGPCPAIWDGTGTWQTIQGSFDLMKDRLGIRCTAKNPNEWVVGKDAATGAETILKLVEANALNTAPNLKVYFRLLCTIESDEVVRGFAGRRDTAALAHQVTRYVDASDRYAKHVVTTHSPNNTGSDPVVTRDDADAARAEAVSLRDATDAGVLDGPIVIPRFTAYYELGDRIRKINGRELGLRTDGGDDKTTPIYPVVQAIKWVLKGRVSTHLTISDANLLRRSYRRQQGGGTWRNSHATKRRQ